MTDWATSAIAAELAGAATGYAKALAELAGAADYAEGAAEHMLPGYPGVARSIRQIKQEIETNQREVTELAARIPPLTQAVEQVGSDWTPHQVIAALAPVADELERLPRDTLYTANAKLGDTEVLIRRLLQGGSPEYLQARVQGPHSILRAVHVRLGRAKDATDAVLAAAREAGDGGGVGSASGGGQQPPEGPPPAPAGTPADGPEPVGRGAPAPSYVRDAVGDLPERTDKKAPTHGLVFGLNGTRLTGQPLRSGKDPRAGEGLKPAWRLPYPATDHVEGHVASRMRRGELPGEVVLLLNNVPCAGVMGCDVLLPEWLKAGHTVHVYVPGPEGARWFNTYHGTGKGVVAP